MAEKTKEKKINIKDALTVGWEITTENFMFLLGIVILMYVWQFSSSYFVDLFELKIVNIVLQVLFYAITTLLSLGFIKISLKFIKKEKPNIEDLFSCKNQIINKMIADLIYGVMVVAGLIVFIVPGIYLSIKYGFYSQLIVEKKLGPIEALKASSEMTKNVKMRLFVFLIVLAIVNMLGVLLFGIGLLFTIPMTVLAHVYVYKKLSSQVATKHKLPLE